ncbi:MAG: lysophospholipid acyltransferase family protein [Pyrinomonadaceae bacterium]|nr:lysophospholipid acyltransferase family protein [Phycisphaerales bacterium]
MEQIESWQLTNPGIRIPGFSSKLMSRKKKKLPLWAHVPAYWAVRSAMAVVSIGDLAGTVEMARSAARAFASAAFNRKRLQRAQDNLAVAFPDWSAEHRREYSIKAYEHMFTLFVETIAMPRLLSEDGWARHVRLGAMQDSVRELLSRVAPQSGPNKPCVLITGHTGNWELIGYTMALLGFPMHALFRPADIRPVDRWLRTTRQSRGLVLVDKFGAAQSLPKLLDQGFPVGFVADQNGGHRGLFVPYFDRLASAYKSIGLLALKYDTPIVCGQARRLVWERDAVASREKPLDDSMPSAGQVGFDAWRGEPFRYQIDVVDVIHPADWVDQPDPLFYVTARYRRAIETMVRRAPEQYLWMHRCWKSRPRHEHQGRPIPSSMMAKIEALPWMTPEKIRRLIEWTRRDAAALAAQSA